MLYTPAAASLMALIMSHGTGIKFAIGSKKKKPLFISSTVIFGILLLATLSEAP